MFSVKISFVPRERQAFFLHFLASSTGEEYSFYILLFSAMAEELLAKTVWRLLMPYMGEHRKTTVANLSSDCTQVALDSFRLKSTEDQGEIELRNIEAGVLQVLFGMLHLLVDFLNIFHYF